MFIESHRRKAGDLFWCKWPNSGPSFGEAAPNLQQVLAWKEGLHSLKLLRIR